MDAQLPDDLTRALRDTTRDGREDGDHAARHDALRARILASRARGTRVHPSVLLSAVDAPDHDGASYDVARAPRRWSRVTLVAAGLAAAAAIGVFVRPQPVEAGMIGGQMTLSPAMPRAGEVVTVRYAAGATLGRPATLRLRARTRTVHNESYEGGVPVLAIGTLHRSQGNEYTGTFTLPDSVVYAALAVEDSASRAVDDFGGRAWEVMQAGANGEPTLAALDQRVHDMMGRSWEEGLATARRMIALYPDSLEAWNWMRLFESWMSLETDSTRALHRSVIRRFATRFEAQPPSAHDIGRMYWYTRISDTTYRAAWRARLLREAPTDGFAVQERLYDADAVLRRGDTTAALATFDSLWRVAPADRRLQVIGVALRDMATTERYAASIDLWTARAKAEDSAFAHQRELAVRLLAIPSRRAQATDWLRRLVRESAAPSALPRRLGEDVEEHAARQRRLQRSLLTVLGTALLDAGQAQAAADTLRLATAAGWDPTAFEAHARAMLMTGDTAGAMQRLAFALADPSLSAARRRTLEGRVPALWSGARFASVRDAAPAELSRRVMADARRRLVDDVSVRDAQGNAVRLSSMRGPRGMVVAFWSMNCGPAIEALPEMLALADQLAARGMPVVFVTEQPAPDAALDSLMRTHTSTRALHFDAGGAAGKAYNNWGTPMLYVVDADGRVPFAGTSEVPTTRLRAEALLSAR